MLIEVNDDNVVFTTKGMKTDTLTTKINNGDSEWNTSSASRCNIDNDDYWDVDGSEDTVIEVQTVTFDSITTNLSANAGVCFSKNARWFSGAGDLLSGTGDSAVVDESLFVCKRTANNSRCLLSVSGEPNDKDDSTMYSIDWTRFGEITMDKWSSTQLEWILQN